MNYTQIIILTVFGLAVVMLSVINALQNNLIKAYRLNLKEKYSQDKELVKFCLNNILIISIQKEDYETAQKCKNLLDGFKKEDGSFFENKK